MFSVFFPFICVLLSHVSLGLHLSQAVAGGYARAVPLISAGPLSPRPVRCSSSFASLPALGTSPFVTLPNASLSFGSLRHTPQNTFEHSTTSPLSTRHNGARCQRRHSIIGAPGWTRHTRLTRWIYRNPSPRYEHTPADAFARSASVCSLYLSPVTVIIKTGE